jgi:hypothetical protein
MTPVVAASEKKVAEAEGSDDVGYWLMPCGSSIASARKD